MQWLHFEKSSPDTLYFKHSAADGLEMFSEMSMKVKNCRGRQKQFPKHLPTVKEKPVLSSKGKGPVRSNPIHTPNSSSIL